MNYKTPPLALAKTQSGSSLRSLGSPNSSKIFLAILGTNARQWKGARAFSGPWANPVCIGIDGQSHGFSRSLATEVRPATRGERRNRLARVFGKQLKTGSDRDDKQRSSKKLWLQMNRPPCGLKGVPYNSAPCLSVKRRSKRQNLRLKTVRPKS